MNQLPDLRSYPKFLKYISNQPGKYLALSTKYQGRWRDFFFTDFLVAQVWLEDQPKGADIYFCPVKLSQPRRKKEFCCESRYLWSDLDFVDPAQLPVKLRPTVAWESSPGRYQCLWELTKPQDPLRLQEVNRQLTYFIGADKGGWDLTQVLRIPGTVNYKYPSKPRVKLLWREESQYTLREVRRIITRGTETGISKDVSETTVTRAKTLRDYLHAYRGTLHSRTLTLLRATSSPVGKRSDILWSLAHSLAEQNIPKNDAYEMLRLSVWNKYKDRSDERQRLTHDIEEAYKTTKSVETVLDAEDNKQLPFISYNRFMAGGDREMGWLVDEFWTEASHGIVAGEPKTLKSTILMDLIVAVASGEPFLDQFEVRNPGPVIYIQNENSDPIVRDRFFKITSSLDLAGHTDIDEGNDKRNIYLPRDLPITLLNNSGFMFSDPHDLKAVELKIREVKPRLIAFDPLYLMFEGDVNSAQQLTPALSWLMYLKQTYNCAVILVHHWNKHGESKRGGQRMLGSTILHGWTESAWYLALNPDATTKQEIDGTEYSNVLVTCEREFRGAGIYPKVDFGISMRMGKEVENQLKDYSVTLLDHKHHEPIPSNRNKKIGRPKLESSSLEDKILAKAQELKTDSVIKISEALHHSRKVVRPILRKLQKEGKLL